MIDATVAKRGVISDEELLIICLKNAPEGTDRKQVKRLLEYLESAPRIVIPQQGVLYIETELEEPPKYLEGLDKLSQRKSPWETNE